MIPTKPDILSLHQFLTYLVTNELSGSFNIDYRGIHFNVLIDDYTKRLDEDFFKQTFKLNIHELSNDEAQEYYMKYIRCFVKIESRVDREIPKHRNIDFAVVTDVNEPAQIIINLHDLKRTFRNVM